LAAELLGERDVEYWIRSFKMTPSSGGRFEVTVNGELVFSKATLKRHAEAGEIRRLILQQIEAVRPPDWIPLER